MIILKLIFWIGLGTILIYLFLGTKNGRETLIETIKETSMPIIIIFLGKSFVFLIGFGLIYLILNTLNII